MTAIKQNLNIKHLGLGFLGGAMLVLSGCGSEDEVLSDARAEIYGADTSTSTTTLTLDADEAAIERLDDPESASMMSSIMGSSLTVDMMSDNIKEQHEMNMGLSINASEGMSMNFDLPLFMDASSETVYTSVVGIRDLMGMLIPIDIPEAELGKVVDLSTMAEDAVNDQISTSTVSGLETGHTDEINDIFQEYLATLPDDATTVEDDVYTQVFNGNEMIHHIAKEMQARELVTSEQVDELLTGLGETISIGDVKHTTTLVDDQVSTEHVVAPMTVLTDGEPEFTFDIIADTMYDSINEPVDFTMDISDDNIMTMDELEGHMQQSTMDMYSE